METHKRGSSAPARDCRTAAAGARLWRVGGAERPFDPAGQQWRSQLLAVLDTTWELYTLRGQVSSLRGEISSIQGERSSLRGEISSLHGEVSSMRGHASSIRGEESSFRGEISSIEDTSARCAARSLHERGAISSLNRQPLLGSSRPAARRCADRQAREGDRALEQDIRDYNAERARRRRRKANRDLERRQEGRGNRGEIKAFDLDARLPRSSASIAKLDVEGKTGAIEGKIRDWTRIAAVVSSKIAARPSSSVSTARFQPSNSPVIRQRERSRPFST